MNYLVTGAAGFIGSRFVESCNHIGDIDTISVDNLSSFYRPEHLNIDFGNKVDIKNVIGHLSRDELGHIDAIVHLGAISDTTCDDIHLLRELNTDFSYALWKYASSKSVPLFYASSASTYGSSKIFSDDEKIIHTLQPLNHYGASKHAFDLSALESERRGVSPPRWAGFKFFNVYGYGEKHKNSMSSMPYKALTQIKQSNKIKLFRSHQDGIKDGQQSRDFVYIQDVLNVLHWSIFNVNRGIYNLGSGNAYSFLDLAFYVFEILDIEPNIDWVDTPRNIKEHYQYYTRANMTKLTASGYRLPFTDLKRGIELYAAKLGYV